MNINSVEHVNLTVSDPDRSAAVLERIFGWSVRWQGTSPMGGRVVHVGNDSSYIAFYSPPGELPEARTGDSMSRPGFNHLGVVVDDLERVESKVREEGLQPYGHEDYDPGRRFYFIDGNAIEFEVVQY